MNRQRLLPTDIWNLAAQWNIKEKKDKWHAVHAEFYGHTVLLKNGIDVIHSGNPAETHSGYSIIHGHTFKHSAIIYWMFGECRPCSISKTNKIQSIQAKMGSSSASDFVVLTSNGGLATERGSYITCKGSLPITSALVAGTGTTVKVDTGTAVVIGTVAGSVTTAATTPVLFSKFGTQMSITIPAVSVTATAVASEVILFTIPALAISNASQGAIAINCGTGVSPGSVVGTLLIPSTTVASQKAWAVGVSTTSPNNGAIVISLTCNGTPTAEIINIPTFTVRFDTAF